MGLISNFSSLSGRYYIGESAELARSLLLTFLSLYLRMLMGDFGEKWERF